MALAALASALLGSLATSAQAQSESAQVVIAQAMYDRGDYAEAAETLQRLLRRGRPTPEDRQTAGVVLARSFTQLGKEGAARQAFVGVLRQNPQWQPDSNWPANEQAVARAAAVEFAVQQAEGFEPEGSEAPSGEPGPDVSPGADEGGKWWLWPAAGAIAIGGLLAALL